jgi:hypothetical protein
MGKDYLKIKQRYGLFLSKLLQTHNSLKITRLIQFWQPRGVAELWDGMKKKRGYGVFIGEDCYQLSEKQWTFVNPSVHPILFVQLSKGCIIRLGIIERVMYKFNCTRQLHESIVVMWLCKCECRTHRESCLSKTNF